MSQPAALPRAVDNMLSHMAGLGDIPAPPAPVTVRVSRHEGALVVTSDGTNVSVELTDPIRLGAEELGKELTSAINEANEQAREQLLKVFESTPGMAEMGTLSQELVSAYEEQMRELDERIAKVAGE